MDSLLVDNDTDKVIKAKNDLDETLKSFGNSYQNCNKDKKCIEKLTTDLISQHTKMVNVVNNVLGTIHRKHDFFVDKNLQQDYAGTLENFIPVSLKLVDTIKLAIEKNELNKFKINENTYITIQRFVNTFSKQDTKNKLKIEFQNRGISTIGFSQKFTQMKERHLKMQLWIGIPMLAVTAGIVYAGEYFLGQPFTGLQLILGKALISLSVSIVGSTLIEGNAETKWTLQKGLSIRAIGWVAVFLLLFYVNPASPGDVH